MRHRNKVAVARYLGNNPVIYWAIGLITLGVAYKFYKGASDAAGGVADALKDQAQQSAINSAVRQSGVTDVRANAVQTAATDIYDALHKDSLWGWGEDEKKAVEAFNSLLSINEAKACAGLYKTLFKKGLYSDLEKYCNGSNWRSLKSNLLAAIKGL